MKKSWVIFRRSDTGMFDAVPYRRGAAYRGKFIEIFTGSDDDLALRLGDLADSVFLMVS